MPGPSPPAPLTADFVGRGLACARGERLVFADLAFTVPPGGILALTGPNGSGKSSLLRLMAGLTPAAAGMLSWDGAPIGDDRAAHRARLHFIGHQDALKPGLTAAEMLEFWAGLRGGGDVEPALAQFHLSRLADSPCRLLSAGQRRRLALARLVASPAPLWLLDEPTSALDAEATVALFAAIAQHRATGGRIVLSTHAVLPMDGVAVLSLADFRPRRAAQMASAA
jgi:heme exporter protein A